MNCRKTQKLLSERALGLLRPEKEAKLQAHLEQCRDCARAARELELCAQLLAEQPSLVMAPDLARRVAQKAAEQKEPRRLTGFFWAPVMVAAALILVTLAWKQTAVRPRPDAEEVMAYYHTEFEALGFWNNRTQDENDDWNYEIFGIPDTVSRHLL